MASPDPAMQFVHMIMKNCPAHELEEMIDSIDVNFATNCIRYDGKTYEPIYSLLMFASHYDHLEAFRLLISHGSDPLYQNNTGASVLMMIAKRGQFEMAHLCFDAVKEEERHKLVNLPNNIGWTPLMAAIENNQAKVANWLLQNGADPKATMFKTKWTPLHVAAKKENSEMIGDLQRSGADNSIEAHHKEFGYNARATEVLTTQGARNKKLAKQTEEIKILQHKSNGKVGKRAFIAMITFTKFRTSKGGETGWTERKGAEFDELLGDTFKEAFECEVISFKESYKSKDNYFQFLNTIKVEIRKAKIAEEKFDLLMVVVSSHGATDSNGQFFQDCEKKKLYVDEDLRDRFSVDQFPEMMDMSAVFIINACRDLLAAEKFCVKRTEVEPPKIPANNVTIQVTTKGQSALRSPNYGTLALQMLNQTVQKYKATLSLQDMIAATQDSFLDPLEGRVQINGKLQYQRFEITSNTILKDVFFKPARL